MCSGSEKVACICLIESPMGTYQGSGEWNHGKDHDEAKTVLKAIVFGVIHALSTTVAGEEEVNLTLLVHGLRCGKTLPSLLYDLDLLHQVDLFAEQLSWVKVGQIPDGR